MKKYYRINLHSVKWLKCCFNLQINFEGEGKILYRGWDLAKIYTSCSHNVPVFL